MAEKCTEPSTPFENKDVEQTELVDCPVCLQPFTHPVELPCKHVFCYLCVKGVANRSKKCALCRTEIPPDYLFKPALVRKEDLVASKGFSDGYQWYYEGNRGWWQYDERTAQELETQYHEGGDKMEVLIAGFLYIIDFKNMIQFRRNDPSRCRRIKRDALTIPKKGIAGISLKLAPSTEAEERPSGDGFEGEEMDSANKGSTKSTTAGNVTTTTLASSFIHHGPQGTSATSSSSAAAALRTSTRVALPVTVRSSRLSQPASVARLTAAPPSSPVSTRARQPLPAPPQASSDVTGQVSSRNMNSNRNSVPELGSQFGTGSLPSSSSAIARQGPNYLPLDSTRAISVGNLSNSGPGVDTGLNLQFSRVALSGDARRFIGSHDGRIIPSSADLDPDSYTDV